MAVGEPPDGPDRRQRRGWWIAAGLLALLLVVGLVMLWVQAPALYGKGDVAKTAAATTRGAILTVVAALIAAAAAGAGLYMTARTIRINQQALVETQRANRSLGGITERSLAWLTGYRRFTLRYERSARLFTAFLTLAATLTCYKRLPT